MALGYETHPERERCAVLRKLEPDEAVDEQAGVRRDDETRVHRREPLPAPSVPPRERHSRTTHRIADVRRGDDV